jgi:hypothetical protein
VALSRPGSGVSCAGNGARRVGVHDQGREVAPPLKPPDSFFYGGDLSVEGNLFAPKRFAALPDGVSSAPAVGGNQPSEAGGAPKGAIRPRVTGGV